MRIQEWYGSRLITEFAQDCQYWLAYLGMQCRLHELRHKRRISVAAASKILANLVYSYKGMGLSMGTMCAGVTPTEGPALYYIDSDGTRLSGNLFCVGSGQTFAYGVLDAEYKYELEDEEALELGKRSILAATHRDAFSGGYINLYHVKEDGWVKHGFMDTNPICKSIHHAFSRKHVLTSCSLGDQAQEGRVQQRHGRAGVETRSGTMGDAFRSCIRGVGFREDAACVLSLCSYTEYCDTSFVTSERINLHDTSDDIFLALSRSLICMPEATIRV
jgi:hypothetical protein